jgi:hypothetical protein
MPAREFQVSPVDAAHRVVRLMSLVQRNVLLGESADHDGVTIWIPERYLFRSSGGIHMRFLVESGYKSAGSLQCQVEVIDTEEHE